MASIANIPVVGGFNRKSIGATVLVILVILGLFFIPEILSFQQGATHSNSQGTRASSVATSERSGTQLETATPLERVMYMLDTKGIQKAEVEPTKTEEQTSSGSLFSPAPKVKLDAGWKVIVSKQGRQALSKARKDSLAIIRKIKKQNNSKTSFALMNFANGINFILSPDARKQMPSDKAAQYLVQLYTAVTRSMIAERMERGTYLTWTDVSLAPIVSQSVTTGITKSYLTPFRPSIQLAEARVSIRNNGQTSVHAKGFISGTDVRDLYLLRNGMLMRKLGKSKTNTFDGQSRFSFSAGDASGRYTIRAVDLKGAHFDANYEFGSRGATPKNQRGPDTRYEAMYRVR